MSQKDQRPPVGVGAENAAFGNAAKSSEDYTILEVPFFYIPARDRNTWLRMGMAVKSQLGDGGFDLWDEWRRTADNYDLKAARTTLALHHARRSDARQLIVVHRAVMDAIAADARDREEAAS
jgi:Primase C terminal 2 (PriCT-2)